MVPLFLLAPTTTVGPLMSRVLSTMTTIRSVVSYPWLSTRLRSLRLRIQDRLRLRYNENSCNEVQTRHLLRKRRTCLRGTILAQMEVCLANLPNALELLHRVLCLLSESKTNSRSPVHTFCTKTRVEIAESATPRVPARQVVPLQLRQWWPVRKTEQTQRRKFLPWSRILRLSIRKMVSSSRKFLVRQSRGRERAQEQAPTRRSLCLQSTTLRSMSSPIGQYRLSL